MSDQKIEGSKSKQKAKDSNSKVETKGDELGVLFNRFGWGIPIFTMVLVIAILFSSTCSPLNSIIAFVGIAAACLAFGGAIGFLFGIPRAQKQKPTPVGNGAENLENQSNGFYNDNTNLEEISDWLTKIILGLTLVELKPILSHINIAAVNFSSALGGKCCSTCADEYYAFAYAVLVFYFLSGGGLSYLWTRSNLLSILEERRLERMRKQNQKLNERNESLYSKLSQASRIVNEVSRETSVKAEVNPVLDTSQADSGNPIPPINEQFRNETLSIYKSRKVKDEEDLQAQRWGGVYQNKDVRLSAKYKPHEGSNAFYRIELTLESINPEYSLGTEVAFFLHDTFPNEVEFVPVINNRATIALWGFEAFVVGARTESGIELELDLNKVKGFPHDFYY